MDNLLLFELTYVFYRVCSAIIHGERWLVIGLLVRDFLKPCSDGRPTLKVLMATSSKSPSISLNISQYLSEYAFMDSPSLIDMDNKKSKG